MIRTGEVTPCIFSDVVISEGTFTHGGVLTSNSAALKATQYKLHYSHFSFLHKHFIRKTWKSLPLRHWQNPRRSTTCRWSGRNTEARLGKGVSHSSAARCARPWCVFADWREGFSWRIGFIRHTWNMERGLYLLAKLPPFCWEWPSSVKPWRHNTFHHVLVWRGKPASRGRKGQRDLINSTSDSHFSHEMTNWELKLYKQKPTQTCLKRFSERWTESKYTFVLFTYLPKTALSYDFQKVKVGGLGPVTKSTAH